MRRLVYRGLWLLVAGDVMLIGFLVGAAITG